MNIKNVLIAGAATVALASCGNENKKSATETNNEVSRIALDPANIDSSVSPAENFFYYANGNWLKNNPVPGDQTRWGSFNQLIDNNQAVLKDLLESAAASKAAAGSKEQKVGDLYKSGMDTVAIEKAGIAPLSEHLTRINNIKDANGIMAEVGLEHTLGASPLYSFYISPDDRQVTKMISQFSQGGLGMPDRDYYFNKDEASLKIQEAYKKYLVTLFTLMGEDAATAEKDAADLYKFETTLADASMTRTAMRDPQKLYNKKDIKALNAMTPGTDWKMIFSSLKVAGEDSAIIATPGFFAEVNKQLKATPIDQWKKYLQAHLVMDFSPYLSKAFAQPHFEFYGTVLSGQKQEKPRWKRVLQVVDGTAGELLGQMYVDKTFKPEAKKRMLDLVNNLQETYAERIKQLDWMSEPTKQKALAKLNTFIKKIGYPDEWKNYDALTVGNDYMKNIMNASAFEYNFQLGKLGKPVDRKVWGMTPPTVNAYYNPSFNEIVFPAGILQWPFFDEKADDAVNYGGIGGVIGHEITHGFDDQGRQYDENGNLKDWWTPADAKAFLAKTKLLIEQYNNYTVLGDVHVKGDMTQGENLADLGGVSISYAAFKKTAQGKSNEKIDGFTPDQRFFLSWAQVWRANTLDQEMRKRIVTDVHSPAEHRCNGPLSNFPAFYEAFNVKPGDKMYRADSIRIKVW